MCRITMKFVNRELSAKFQTELGPSLITDNGEAKVVYLRAIHQKTVNVIADLKCTTN